MVSLIAEPGTPEWWKRAVLRISQALQGYIPAQPILGDYADDAAAEAAGVPLYGLYRNGNAVQQRVT